MHLIVTIDLAGEAFRHGNIGSETARILHNSAERLVALHTKYGALSYENPEQLYLLDNAGAMVGYVSTVEIDDITPAAQRRIAEHIAAAAGSTHPINRPPIHTTGSGRRNAAAVHARRRVWGWGPGLRRSGPHENDQPMRRADDRIQRVRPPPPVPRPSS